jgi:hypothetical protein
MSRTSLLSGCGLLNKLLTVSVVGLVTVATIKYTGAIDTEIIEKVGDKVDDYLNNPKNATGLKKFTGFWIPIQLMGKFTPSEYILGLVYLEDDNVFGEFEGPAEFYKAKGRWMKITEFDYDEATGVLTIDFAKNNPERGRDVGTFRIDDNDHLFMTNPGGTYEFFRGDEENMEKNNKQLQEEYERKARNRPMNNEPYGYSIIPKGDTRQ